MADQSVTLAWDANPEPDVSAYVIHYGTSSRQYPYSTNVGNVTRATVNGLQAGLTYYFAVTATNSAGLESDYSNEVSTFIPADLTNSFPTISTISNQLLYWNSDPPPLPFTIGDAETPAAYLGVTAWSSNELIIPQENLFVSGDGANRILMYQLMPDVVGQLQVRVSVSDGMKSVSTFFLVTVSNVPGPLPPSHPRGLRAE
jgi:hypothetical protein